MQAKPNYTIVPVDLKDAEICAKIKKLHKKCFPHDDVLEPDEGYWWVVKHETDVVGFCAMRQSTRWVDCGYLWRAGVHPDHRGQGLQRRMILVRERKARRIGWNFLISDTNDNVQSANNLIRAGYKMYDPSWPYAFPTTCYWRKNLNAKSGQRETKAVGKNVLREK
jgi:GNAT superfamily N-acetyltransferase